MSIWTDDQLLTLNPPRQRADAFRFDLLDVALQPIGSLQPNRGQAPTLTLDTGRTIMRTLTGMFLDVSQTAQVNPLSDRVRAWVILENGSEFPLGVFLFSDDPRKLRSFGSFIDAATLSDQWLILDQQLPEGISFPRNTNLRDALLSVVTAAGIISLDIESTGQTLKDPLSWEIGRRRVEAVQAIAQAAGWVTYFDNQGTFIARTPPDLATAVPTFTYGPGGVVADDSIALGNDLLDAPNLYVVISTNSREVPVVGRFEVPPSAPHSFLARGFYVPEVIQQQGLTTQVDADAAARAAAAEDDAGYEWAQFSTAFDPRHDTYDVVNFAGENYRETGWSVPLFSGGQQAHSLRKVYS